MLNDQKLARLVRAAETLSDREADPAVPRKPSETPIDATQAAAILAYLHAPYENGYWELKATWNSASPLAVYLLEELGTLVETEKDAEASAFLPASMARKLPEEKREELLRVSSRLSPINMLFRAIVKTSSGAELPRIPELDSWIKRVDLSQFKIKFSDALDIFDNKIYFDGMLAGVGTSKLYRIKTGLVSFLEVPRAMGAIHIVGTQHSDLCSLRDFYAALGVLSSPTVGRVFAPDDALFRPYFSLVSSVLPHVIQDGQVSKVFSQALNYYQEEDFQHCISTLGLIAEDYLQRIFTTLLREQISGGLTLGQTLDRLHKRIDDLFAPAKLSQKTVDAAYDQIKSLDTTAGIEGVQAILREIISLIQDDRSHFGKRIDEVLKPPVRRTPFPGRVSDNLNELLKWRNAASHNSRVPLGAHEADRTLYCLVSLVTWWQEQVGAVDWSGTRLSILESLLQTARQAVAK